MNEKVRMFIAVDLPEGVKDLLVETAVQMSQTVSKRAIRWVRREQMHLTLRFLGDTAVAQLPALQQEITELAANHQPFELRLNGVGAFPNRKRPRAVWAGLGGDLASLQKLQAELEERVVALGWVREQRPFSPHLTLGRVKEAGAARGLNWAVRVAEKGFGVTAVQLVQSELRPSGAQYTVHLIATLNQ